MKQWYIFIPEKGVISRDTPFYYVPIGKSRRERMQLHKLSFLCVKLGYYLHVRDNESITFLCRCIDSVHPSGDEFVKAMAVRQCTLSQALETCRHGVNIRPTISQLRNTVSLLRQTSGAFVAKESIMRSHHLPMRET